MEGIKTLWQLLQEVIENDNDKRYSIHEFLLYSTKADRKRIEKKLTDADSKQFYDYMDGYNFVNSDEVYMAVSEYYEKIMDRALYMWELGDMYEIAETYMQDRNLEFEDN